MTHFDWNFPYPARRMPVLANNVVATSQPLAAQAGLSMLAQGGNAVDAALATAIALTVVEPCSNGVGSDLFALVWDKELLGLNASGRSPAAWSFERFKHLAAMPRTGWDTITIPGAVSGWVALSERLGRLPFATLFEPAIRYARQGYPVSPIVAEKWRNAIPVLQHVPGFAQMFMPHERSPDIGELFSCADLADTLEKIASSKGEAFYRGELAEKMIAHSRAHGGVHTLTDFAEHRADWVTPIAHRYRDYTVHELPPNSQGIAALIALGIIEQFDISSLPVDSVQSAHLQIEAMKLAFADTYQYVADPAAMKLAASSLLDRHYLAQRAKLITLKQAQDFQHGLPASGGTVYLTAADAEGMMVSLIQSNYQGFGSGIVVPGTGISLQNRGSGFSLTPGHANQVDGRKRPFHTIIPAFLSRQGKPVMSFGVMGGNMQPQGHLQVLVRLIDYRQNPQTALDAPRWKVATGLSLDLEASFNPVVRQQLVDMGHRLSSEVDPYMDFGAGQLIYQLEDSYLAASDLRRDGQAVGF